MSLKVVKLLGGDGASPIPEWTGIELQGTLTQRDGASNPAGRKIGDLTLCDAKGEHAMLIIGNHQLKGKRVELAKPLAITRKRVRDEGRRDGSSSESEGPSSKKRRPGSDARESELDELTGKLNVDSEYEIVGVMRSKYIFKTRPKPINNMRAMTKKRAKKP